MHPTCEKTSLAMTHKLDNMIELPKSQPKETYKEDLKCEMVMVKVPRYRSFIDYTIAYDEPIGSLDIRDKVDDPCLQSTLQVLPLFEEYTPPVTYPEEVEETLGTPMEVEPLNLMKLEDVGFDNHSIPTSYKEFPIFDEPKPQPQPLHMDKDPTTPLLIGRGFLATANAVIDCRKAKIAVGEGVTRSMFGVKEIDLGEEEVPYWTTLEKRESYTPRPSTDGIGARPPYYAKKDFTDYHLPSEWEIARDAEFNPFKDVLLEDLIEIRIDWNKKPKRGDGAWHAKIRLIDPDEEKFTKTFQSIPTTRKLSEKENQSEIIVIFDEKKLWSS
ncbi:hypothetical protein Tco_0484428 [Tanacetum coccineum]